MKPAHKRCGPSHRTRIEWGNMDNKNEALERRACALFKQYGLFLPRPVKDFFSELADHLNWQDLKKGIK